MTMSNHEYQQDQRFQFDGEIKLLAATVVKDYRESIKRNFLPEVDAKSREVYSSSSSDIADDDGYLSNVESSNINGSERKLQDRAISAEELLEERRSKNRLSAQHSRLRKRRQLKYLEQQVMLLSEENKRLLSLCESNSREVAALRAENAQLRILQQNSLRVAATFRNSQCNVGPGMFNPF